MSNLIGVVNYGIAGNIYSVKRAIEEARGEAFVINHVDDFGKADKIVIPGVGSFKESMKELEATGFVEKIVTFQGPILGICLGMQILSRLGFEFGVTKGLNLLEAEVKAIVCDGEIPHVGFNRINVVKGNKLLNGVEDEEFYFMHSYEMINYTNVAALTVYHGHSFVSSVHSGNLYGVQFHPEKSRDAGIRLLNNFVQLR
jgi:imidazole glycerol phosphate synthase glutamine amidotransferase subunit